MALDRPFTRSHPRPAHVVHSWWRTAFVVTLGAVAGGIVLGVGSGLGDNHDAPEFVRWVANIPGPWVLLAFALGAAAGSRVWGAIAGVLGLTCGVASYYTYLYQTGERPWLDTVEHALVVWTVVAVAAGIVFGIAGASWRAGPAWQRIVAVVLLCGVLAGESALVAAEQTHPAERLMVISEVVLAAILIWTLLPGLRHRVTAAVLTCGASAAAVEALVVFTDRLHGMGL